MVYHRKIILPYMQYIYILYILYIYIIYVYILPLYHGYNRYIRVEWPNPDVFSNGERWTPMDSATPDVSRFASGDVAASTAGRGRPVMGQSRPGRPLFNGGGVKKPQK